MSERWYRAFGQPQYGEEGVSVVSQVLDPGVAAESMSSPERPSISVRGLRSHQFKIEAGSVAPEVVLARLRGIFSTHPYEAVPYALPPTSGSTTTLVSVRTMRPWHQVRPLIEQAFGPTTSHKQEVALLRPSEVLPEDLPAGLQEVPDTAAGLFTPLVVGGAVGGTMLLVGGAVVGTLLLSRWLFRE